MAQAAIAHIDNLGGPIRNEQARQAFKKAATLPWIHSITPHVSMGAEYLVQTEAEANFSLSGFFVTTLFVVTVNLSTPVLAGFNE